MAKLPRPLKYVNNWEADEYSVDGKPVKDLRAVKINGKRYVCYSRIVSVLYSDMGHTYLSTSRHYFVTAQVFGLKTEFDLNKIISKTAIEAVEWEE